MGIPPIAAIIAATEPALKKSRRLKSGDGWEDGDGDGSGGFMRWRERIADFDDAKPGMLREKWFPVGSQARRGA
jgi:hypothetical protein